MATDDYDEKYTEPELRRKLKEEIRASDKGGKKGQWSARKSQLLVHEYEKHSGGYKGEKDEAAKSLDVDGPELADPGGRRKGAPGRRLDQALPAREGVGPAERRREKGSRAQKAASQQERRAVRREHPRRQRGAPQDHRERQAGCHEAGTLRTGTEARRRGAQRHEQERTRARRGARRKLSGPEEGLWTTTRRHT